MKRNREKVFEYINLIGSRGVTNTDIRKGTGIEPHQQVFQLTQKLLKEGLIQGKQYSKEWLFYPLGIKLPINPPTLLKNPIPKSGIITPRKFEELARSIFSRHFDCNLVPGTLPGVPKEFDMVSPDNRIVGDAKYLTMVRGNRPPPAKFSVIAEYVWLLEKTSAEIKFLAFGNDRRVPDLWLKKYGKLTQNIIFFFVSEEKKVQLLHR